MKTSIHLIFACIFALNAGHAKAMTIAFNPLSTDVSVSDTFDVDVNISGLGNEIVSAFGFNILYDANIVSASNISFNNQLNNGIHFFSLQSFSIDDSTHQGHINISEISFLPDSFLESIQLDNVTLATLSFTAIATGTSALDFSFDLFQGVSGTGAHRLNLTESPGAVSVEAINIPEPPTAFLIIAAILALMMKSKRI